MCQIWPKQLENEGVMGKCRGFPLLSSVNTFISFDEDKGKMDNALLNFYHKYFGE